MKKLLFLCFFLTLSGCSSIFEKSPVGIGTDISELKRSPCACLKKEMIRELPDWFMRG